MATTTTRDYDAAVQVIGTGDGWARLPGDESGTTSSDIDLTGKVGVHILPEASFGGTPTDNVEVELLGSHDGTNYDDTAFSSVTIGKGTNPNQISIMLGQDAPAHVQVKMAQDGSTDDHDVRCYVMTWTWSSA